MGRPFINSRLSKDQKRTKKKEAIVTALESSGTLHPHTRGCCDALLHKPCRDDHPARPVPVCKAVRATLLGKATTISSLQQRAAQRDGRAITTRVALTDQQRKAITRIIGSA